MRVLFHSDTVLGANTEMEVRSHLDNESQILDAQSLEEWNYTSAYFNGDGVEVSVWTQEANANVTSEVKIVGNFAGTDPPGNQLLTLCSDGENRTPYNSPADARLLTREGRAQTKTGVVQCVPY
eukprot:TRINITY_DN319_c0_g1_i4.p2 TRINITY_DN319_c0_g1~~TRINITY_DN319_c0_g1_i4.p2  ORF type:complete len:124 (+),score=18.48 TRINITY_DN319_c0_g1_i4:293-664(+)